LQRAPVDHSIPRLWELHPHQPYIVRAPRVGYFIADTSGHPTSWANAVLITAAPDLLEALRGLLDHMQASALYDPTERRAQAALTKALAGTVTTAELLPLPPRSKGRSKRSAMQCDSLDRMTPGPLEVHPHQKYIVRPPPATLSLTPSLTVPAGQMRCSSLRPLTFWKLCNLLNHVGGASALSDPAIRRAQAALTKAVTGTVITFELHALFHSENGV
jgi:hypothetical protein